MSKHSRQYSGRKISRLLYAEFNLPSFNVGNAIVSAGTSFISGKHDITSALMAGVAGGLGLNLNPQSNATASTPPQNTIPGTAGQAAQPASTMNLDTIGQTTQQFTTPQGAKYTFFPGQAPPPYSNGNQQNVKFIGNATLQTPDGRMVNFEYRKYENSGFLGMQKGSVDFPGLSMEMAQAYPMNGNGSNTGVV